jgi:hypothetical protein
MTTTREAGLDPEVAAHLADALNECCSSLAVPDGLFANDALFDLYPPLWRFQIEGPQAFEAQLRVVAGDAAVEARVLRVVPTATGFVLEQEESHRRDHVEVARRVWICEVRDGRIAEATCYCNGGWDDALRARHAAETDLLRP